MTDTPITPPVKSRFLAVLHDMHRTASIWYGYLIGAAIAVKSFDSDISQYVSANLTHWVLGGATALLIADKVRRSIGATEPDALP